VPAVAITQPAAQDSRAAYATPYPAITNSSSPAEAFSEASMLGSATLVMKKSMIGRNAPASRTNTPTGCSPPDGATARGQVGPACRAGRVTVIASPDWLWLDNYGDRISMHP
jgi:hypothetical protein